MSMLKIHPEELALDRIDLEPFEGCEVEEDITIPAGFETASLAMVISERREALSKQGKHEFLPPRGLTVTVGDRCSVKAAVCAVGSR
ncbi:hypothetical protein MLD38_024646 [Melastoma candidum]|uniref:Uncharacterized protein n=1 Tax=Melastoma candidum TaxID=119954 RepID=A0ACB9NVN1_9MYRT|nr:hypothetical protein MLD38_024646 [Melastoma candidum]